MTIRKHSLRSMVVISVCIVAFGFTAGGLLKLLVTGNNAAQRDIVSYWSAAHLFAQHRNPYDPAATAHIEYAMGLKSQEREVIMRNPPWMLPLVLPLSLFSLRSGALAWSVLLALAFAGSIRVLYSMFPKPRTSAVLVCCFFGPATVCLLAGQTSVFALLGVVLFLRNHKASPFIAGMSLCLCLTKPHLFLAFGVAFIVWAVLTKAYSVVLGALLPFVVSCAAVTAYLPSVWGEYWKTMTTWGIGHEVIPCLSVVLARSIAPNVPWLHYVPASLACCWALVYHLTHRAQWDWMNEGLFVLLISVLTAPYAWVVDETVLLPVIASLLFVPASRALGAVALCSAIIELQLFFGVSLHSLLYLWTAPAWLAIFLFARSRNAWNRDAVRLQPLVAADMAVLDT